MKNAMLVFARTLWVSFKTRRSALARLAKNAGSAPVTDWSGHPAVVTIFQAWRPIAGKVNYYLGPTALACVLTVIFGAAAIWSLDWWNHRWGAYVTVSLAAGFLIAAFHATARNYGPALITPERWQAAGENLRVAGDTDARPMGLLLLLVLMAILLVDGAFSGATVIGILENLLTPAWSRIGAVVWGVFVMLMVWHLAGEAAREDVIESRRRLCAQLIDSPIQAQKDLGERMLIRLSPVIGVNVHEPRTRIGKRIALWVAVLMLSAGTFTMRMPSADTSASEMRPSNLIRTGYRHAELRTAEISPREEADMHAEGTQLAGNALLSLFFILTITSVYFLKCRSTMVSASSEDDHRILALFDSESELVAEHAAHFKAVAARADGRLAILAQEVARVRTTLPPQHRDRLPDLRVTFTQLCAAEPQIVTGTNSQGEPK